MDTKHQAHNTSPYKKNNVAFQPWSTSTMPLLEQYPSQTKLFGRERPLHELFGGGRGLNFVVFLSILSHVDKISIFHVYIINYGCMAWFLISCWPCVMEEQTIVWRGTCNSYFDMVPFWGYGIQFYYPHVPYRHCRHAFHLYLGQCCSSPWKVISTKPFYFIFFSFFFFFWKSSLHWHLKDC